MKRKVQGFTLLEILIAVFIIMIIVAIAIPQYNKIIIKAKNAKARHAVSLITEAEKIYQTETGSYRTITAAQTVDNRIGSGVTGIDLLSVDGDNDWNYTVTTSPNQVIATKTGNPCNGETIAWSLDTGSRVGIGACLQ